MLEISYSNSKGVYVAVLQLKYVLGGCTEIHYYMGDSRCDEAAVQFALLPVYILIY